MISFGQHSSKIGTWLFKLNLSCFMHFEFLLLIFPSLFTYLQGNTINFSFINKKRKGKPWCSWNYLKLLIFGLPSWLSGKESACQCRKCKRLEFDPWVRKIPQRRKWQPTPIFLPGESHGQRSLAGYSQWDRKVSDMNEWLSMYAVLENCFISVFIVEIKCNLNLLYSVCL